VRRVLLALAVLAVAAVAVYWFALRGSSTPTAEAQPVRPAAQIGEGKGAVVVGGDGKVMHATSAAANKGKRSESGSKSSAAGEGAKGNPASTTSTSSASAPHLPQLPLNQPPKGGRVRGHVLEEVRVVAAAPRALRPYLAKTGYGETGVEVELTSGIEIRFGDDHEATRKWTAAAAVLADPSVTMLSYVDVHAPTRPAYGGEEHELPPAS